MFKGLFFFARESWKYDKRYIVYAVLAQLLAALVPVLAALTPKYLVEELMGAQRPGVLAAYVALFAGYAWIAGTLTTFLRTNGFEHRCHVDAEFGHAQNQRLTQSDYVHIESPAFRDLQKKAEKFLTCDWHGFGYLLDCALCVLGQGISLIALAGILSVLHPGYVLAFAAFAILCTMIERRAKKKAMALSMDVVGIQRKWLYIHSLMNESMYAKEIRLGGMASWLLARESAHATAYLDNQHEQNRHYIRADMIRASVTFLQQIAAYAFLIVRVTEGGISIGEFTMCVTAVTAFATALQKVMDSLLEIHAYDLYYDKLEEYLSIPAKMREGAQRPVCREMETIDLEDVGFRYPGTATWALRHVNMKLKRGERLALVGENGSGKSTLIKLLCRLYDPTEGRILFNGVDVRELDYDGYLRQFATVFQDFQLFDFSLRDNLTLGERMEDARLVRALRQVGLGERFDTLPDGLDTYVGRRFSEHGFEPSGGEAQKIALARALCKDAPVIVLDEPTAAMDPRAEHALYRDFDGLIRGKTAVYISHRLSSCRFCDRIVVLHAGAIAEEGTHDTLLRTGGRYAELYAMQAQYYTK